MMTLENQRMMISETMMMILESPRLMTYEPRSQGDAGIADIFVVFVVNLITVQNVVRFGKIVQLTAKITVLQVQTLELNVVTIITSTQPASHIVNNLIFP